MSLAQFVSHPLPSLPGPSAGSPRSYAPQDSRQLYSSYQLVYIVYIYIYICSYLFVYIYISRIYVYLIIDSCVCYGCVSMHLSIYASLYLLIYLWNESRPHEVRPKFLVYIYIYICTFIHIHTYIHISNRQLPIGNSQQAICTYLSFSFYIYIYILYIYIYIYTRRRPNLIPGPNLILGRNLLPGPNLKLGPTKFIFIRYFRQVCWGFVW